ncbi:hypothetical protein COU93_03915 [Candidatus Shapirobacteria bacterium CG10_big_fil_rev_8_21_14_0_10_36_6]|uniref:Uncharacterized protein n=2 Tax=Candidatus Shapironibacteriota TaxID=1752721 RepID=A0A2M7BPD5_9BACT|nr:MAG: hypothetical protein COS53_02670 [Candidatus Shapirobacteria bacterium CG03_land_8_20_14_0_80_35_14]PJE66515.1 MAG: hypothetical protein COU93_03915 [Candidatus Shapirobacteria bacterium CG10_big_fil_rev_8_21_14_0_10_36_6]
MFQIYSKHNIIYLISKKQIYNFQTNHNQQITNTKNIWKFWIWNLFGNCRFGNCFLSILFSPYRIFKSFYFC